MKTIQTRNDEGKIYGLVVMPEEGELLNKSQLKKLLPYVKYAVQSETNIALSEKILNSLIVTEDGMSFQNLSEVDSKNLSKLLNIVVDACNSCIKETVIVPQDMGNGSTIRHRVFDFSIKENTGAIHVKYTELGNFNNFDVAIEELSTRYPDAKVFEINENELLGLNI